MENKSPCEFDIINLSYERIKTGRRVEKEMKELQACMLKVFIKKRGGGTKTELKD